jgi:ribosomal protein S18 acetylase RimI-like enzyme
VDVSEVRRATSNDFELARHAVAEVLGRAPVDDAALANFLADGSCYLMIAMEDRRVIGALHGHALRHPHRSQPQFFIYEIDVRPECRNRGVGRALLDAFTAEARAAGAFEQWVLTSRSNPRRCRCTARPGIRPSTATTTTTTTSC